MIFLAIILGITLVVSGVIYLLKSQNKSLHKRGEKKQGFPPVATIDKADPRSTQGPKFGAVEEFPEEPEPLPDAYGETRVVLLPVHPYLVHAYWEVRQEDREQVKHRFGEAWEAAKPVLRFYDVTCIYFDGTNAHSYFDLEVDLDARNWYVHLWSPEKSYIVDLGFKSVHGRYLSIVRSNVAHTPRAWPSMRPDGRHMRIEENYQSEKRELGSLGELEKKAQFPASAEPRIDRANVGSEQAEAGSGSPSGDREIEPESERMDTLELPPLMESAGIYPKKLGGFYKGWEGGKSLRRIEEPPFPTLFFPRVDFTEQCEEKFSFGFSSRSLTEKKES